MDSCFALMFNSCPLVAIAELNTNFPCRDEEFEVETAAEYEPFVADDCLESPHQTPAQLTRDLLHDAWENIARQHITATHLGIAMCGMYTLSPI